jgi:UDP-N-acetylmuramoylalanine--D-glutamate ligase
VAEIGGVTFVNDSKATNIVSAQKAIESFDRGLVVIMGGRFKGGRFEDLRPLMFGRVNTVVAIGEARPLIHDALDDVVRVEDAESMATAVQMAFRAATRGGIVLLAPACSSFDMFRDYAERGRAFKDAVTRLAKEQR